MAVTILSRDSSLGNSRLPERSFLVRMERVGPVVELAVRLLGRLAVDGVPIMDARVVGKEVRMGVVAMAEVETGAGVDGGGGGEGRGCRGGRGGRGVGLTGRSARRWGSNGTEVRAPVTRRFVTWLFTGTCATGCAIPTRAAGTVKSNGLTNGANSSYGSFFLLRRVRSLDIFL